jgi:hypothetical protein
MTRSPTTPSAITPALLLFTVTTVLLLVLGLIVQSEVTSEGWPIQVLLLFRLVIAFQGAVLGFLIPGLLGIGFPAVRVGGAFAVFILVYVASPSEAQSPGADKVASLILALGSVIVAGFLALIAPLTKSWSSKSRRAPKDVHFKLPDGGDVKISEATPEELRKLSDAIKGVVDGDKTD